MAIVGNDEFNDLQAISSQITSTPQNYQFFGSYSHAMDTKGRLILPSAYRGSLGDTFTMGPTRDFQGIALYPNGVFAQLLMEIRAMNPRKPVVQRYAEQVAKLSFPGSQCDGQGRLMIAQALRLRMLGDAKELEISGAFDYVRIMDNAKARLADNYFTDNLEDILEQLGNLAD